MSSRGVNTDKYSLARLTWDMTFRSSCGNHLKKYALDCSTYTHLDPCHYYKQTSECIVMKRKKEKMQELSNSLLGANGKHFVVSFKSIYFSSSLFYILQVYFFAFVHKWIFDIMLAYLYALNIHVVQRFQWTNSIPTFQWRRGILRKKWTHKWKVYYLCPR